jgi:hypothetical protein
MLRVFSSLKDLSNSETDSSSAAATVDTTAAAAAAPDHKEGERNVHVRVNVAKVDETIASGFWRINLRSIRDDWKGREKVVLEIVAEITTWTKVVVLGEDLGRRLKLWLGRS